MKPYNTDQTKKEEVREMFDHIAPKYDLLNHTLSMSIDRLWRRHVVRIVRRAKPRRILDVATGTGDLAIAMARRIKDVQILAVDLSERMLDVARRKVEVRGLDGRIVSIWPRPPSMWPPWLSACATSATSISGSASWLGSSNLAERS